jgi:hypothetical protein
LILFNLIFYFNFKPTSQVGIIHTYQIFPIRREGIDSIQAEWILQSFLIAIKAGYEKSFVYNLSDEPDLLNSSSVNDSSNKNGYVFGSSGLLNNNLEVKRSHSRVVWLTEILNNKQYLGETKEGWMVFTGGLVLRVSPKVEIMKVKKGKYYLISRKMAKKLPN